MTRGQIFFILGCAVFVLALVGAGIALQYHIDTATEHDIRAAEAARTAPPATQASTETVPQYYVGGHVHRQGLLALPATTTQPTLRDALAAAGGPSTDSIANSSVQLSRKTGDKTETTTIPLADVLENRRNDPLRPGDMITVSQKIDPSTLPVEQRVLPAAPAAR